MELISTTPFGQRPFTAALMKRAKQEQAPAQVAQIDKWSLFQDLCAARHAFGISDRDLTVLNALLSFHIPRTLSEGENLIVFPSNKKLSMRAHGMAESTLRRHLAALCNVGLIQRNDSLNGKRYVARGQGGDVVRAFGFDLYPLLLRAKDIVYAAAEAHAAANRIRRLREEVVILKCDALKMIQYAQNIGLHGYWNTVAAELLSIHKRMRRKLLVDELNGLLDSLKPLTVKINAMLQTIEMDGNDPHYERHCQNSDKDSSVFERSSEVIKQTDKITDTVKNETNAASLPLALIIRACPDMLIYAQNEIRHWRDLTNVAEFLRGMMGISPDAWKRAVGIMGAQTATITVVSILQRITEIKNPGGYLRALTDKAADGLFTPEPMIMTLLNKS
jgi:replication initiation protein RepC